MTWCYTKIISHPKQQREGLKEDKVDSKRFVVTVSGYEYYFLLDFLNPKMKTLISSETSEITRPATHFKRHEIQYFNKIPSVESLLIRRNRTANN